MNVLYCANSAIFKGLLLSAASVAKHASENVHFYLLSMDFTELDKRYTKITNKQAKVLEKYIKEINPEDEVTLLDFGDRFKKELSDSPNLDHSYTPYTLLRLFCDDEIMPEKMLYLDVDILAFGDIASIYNTDLCGAELGVILDHLGKVFIRRNYFNAGVLLIDNTECRKTGLFKKARRFVLKKKAPFSDQDALNTVISCAGYLPRRYNEQKKRRPDTVLRHYSKTIRWLPFFHTLNVKPWQGADFEKYYGDDIDRNLFEICERAEKDNPEVFR